MRALRYVGIGVAALLVPAIAHAQATTRHAAGTATETKSQISGEVLYVEGNTLVCKMQPGGESRQFNVPPERKFIIDGQAKTVADLKPGTMLTATVTTKNQDVRVRTLSVVKGTVWWKEGNTVILTLDNGENRQFNVSDSLMVDVDGKKTPIKDVKKGTKIVASKMVEEPETVITSDVTVTGTAPK